MKTLLEAYLSVYNEIHSEMPMEDQPEPVNLDAIKQHCYDIIDAIEHGKDEGEVMHMCNELNLIVNGEEAPQKSTLKRKPLEKHSDRWKVKFSKDEEPPADEEEELS
jgi:hypothetical protein